MPAESDDQATVNPHSGREGSYPFLLMSVGTAHEIWVWLISGASERLRALAELAAEPHSRRATTLRWEEKLLRRLQAAFEFYVQNRPAYYSSWSHEWWSGLARKGVDEIGLALFSRYLVDQLRYWSAVAKEWPGKIEASSPALVEVLSALFHERLRLTPAEVARRAEDLVLDEDLRASEWANKRVWRDVVIQRPEEGFLTRDELEERQRLVVDVCEQLEKAEGGRS